MFSRDSENGVTLELEFLQTPCIRQFFTRQIHLESDSLKFYTANNLHYTVLHYVARYAKIGIFDCLFKSSTFVYALPMCHNQCLYV